MTLCPYDISFIYIRRFLILLIRLKLIFYYTIILNKTPKKKKFGTCILD